MSTKKTKAAEVVFQNGDDLSGLLRSMIDDSGLTRYAIAQQAELSESTLSRMYTGKRPATMETLVAVANTLGRRVVVRVE
jgi:predicted transcriptional regulator